VPLAAKPLPPRPSILPPCRLCKIKYYNNCLFYNVQRNFIAQSGDPTNTGKGGESVWGVLYGEQVSPAIAGG
jgi:cyclophilin family peptidyl-prolyl cis-trans isomerase